MNIDEEIKLAEKQARIAVIFAVVAVTAAAVSVLTVVFGGN